MSDRKPTPSPSCTHEPKVFWGGGVVECAVCRARNAVHGQPAQSPITTLRRLVLACDRLRPCIETKLGGAIGATLAEFDDALSEARQLDEQHMGQPSPAGVATSQGLAGCVRCGDVMLADTEDWGPMCPDHHDEFVAKLRGVEAAVAQGEGEATAVRPQAPPFRPETGSGRVVEHRAFSPPGAGSSPAGSLDSARECTSEPSPRLTYPTADSPEEVVAREWLARFKVTTTLPSDLGACLAQLLIDQKRKAQASPEPGPPNKPTQLADGSCRVHTCVKCGELSPGMGRGWEPSPESSSATDVPSVWRVGRTVGNTLYRDDQFVGSCITPGFAIMLTRDANIGVRTRVGWEGRTANAPPDRNAVLDEVAKHLDGYWEQMNGPDFYGEPSKNEMMDAVENCIEIVKRMKTDVRPLADGSPQEKK